MYDDSELKRSSVSFRTDVKHQQFWTTLEKTPNSFETERQQKSLFRFMGRKYGEYHHFIQEPSVLS